MSSKTARRGLSSFAFLVGAAVLPAQIDIHVDTTLVVIPVAVTDPQNRFVLGLEKSNFRISEDGVEQKISQFGDENAPISAGLLVDTSGSMSMKMDLAREAVTQFLKTMDDTDEAALVEFGEQARVVTSFSKDRKAIEHELERTEPQGLTALLDAVSLGLGEMKRARNTRKALLIISDGGDNHSSYTPTQITELVKQADVQVYAMGVFERFPLLGLSAAELSGPKLLARLSEQTGGRVFSASTAEDLPAIATRIGIELRNQYILAYVPANHKKDGKYHRVEVKVTPPPGLPALKARWRVGYYAEH